MEVLFIGDKKQTSEAVLNLRDVPPFDDPGEWVFRSCTEREFDRQVIPPVVVFFRSGSGSVKFLKKLKESIPPDTRVVFVIGPINERARVFMDSARLLGFPSNFVIGRLPGDYPYTLPVAILKDADNARSDSTVNAEVGSKKFRILVAKHMFITDDRFEVVEVSAPRLAKTGGCAAMVLPPDEGVRPWLKAIKEVPVIVLGGDPSECVKEGVICVSDTDELFRVCSLFEARQK